MQLSRLAALGTTLLATAAVYAQDSTAASGTIPAGAATNPPRPAYRIAGTVLSARDGHTLRHATMRIYPGGRPAAAQTVESDESGQFEFKNVAAGTFVLEGGAPGFVTSNYDQHGNFNTGIVTGAGVDTESLVLTLQPQASLSIHVTDEAGDPVQQAEVELFRKQLDSEADTPSSAGAGTTNDLGQWEARALLPGEYYIVVRATPWYAVHSGQAVNTQQPPFGFANSIQPGLDVAYPMVYYPGTTDESAASPVEVRGGDAAEISMQLHAEPAFSITVPLPPQPTQPLGAQPDDQSQARQVRMYTQVMTRVFGQSQPVNGEQFQNEDHLVFSGLAPGQYELRQQRPGPMGFDTASATSTRITNQSMTAQLPPESRLAHLTVIVKALDGTRVGTPTQVLVMRNGELFHRQTVDPTGAASIDIDPGDYTLDVQGGSRSLHLTQVLAGDKPVPGNRIHLPDAAQANYVLRVTTGNHTVRGVVERDGKPLAGVFVLMIPTADLANPQTFYRDQSDLDGSFQIPVIAAGDYTLFAIQHGWDLDWHKKATYDHYLEHATALHVSENSQALTKLTDPVNAQPR